MQKNVFSPRMAEDIDSRIASYFFRAVAPNDFLLRIERTDPYVQAIDVQAIEDVALDLGILKGRHGAAAIWVLVCSSAGMLCDLRDRLKEQGLDPAGSHRPEA